MDQLVNAETGEPVKEGDILQDFRGDDWKYISLTRQGSRVYVKAPGEGAGNREFFPTVFPGYEIRQA